MITISESHKSLVAKATVFLLLALISIFSVLQLALAELGGAMHAIAMHGEPKYSSGFQHFDYVRPDAPKGGTLRLAEVGSFDSLNPFIIQGVPAKGHYLVFESLLARGFDEPFSLYPSIARSVEMPSDRSWIVFNLDHRARFHDGSPITADDVLFSWQTLKQSGKPNMRSYYSKVTRADKLDEGKVRFEFGDGENWELPLILGLMPILSKSYHFDNPFDQSGLKPLMGSGPYRVAKVDAGRSVTYARQTDYWAKDLPVNIGRYNFDVVRYDYYRDADVALQAFKAGEYDVRIENDAGRWSAGYDHPALRDGRIVREAIPHSRPVGMMALVFNTRRSLFHDNRVRQALCYAFDFEWLNKVLYHGLYSRTRSYFDNSTLAAIRAPSSAERRLLDKYRKLLPEEVFSEPYQPPTTNGSGRIRQNLRTAQGLLRTAGWTIKNGVLVNDADGSRMMFEILLLKRGHERMILPYVRNLRRLGVKAQVRTVDSAQYENRLASFDFDMTVYHWGQSLSPGNEQEIYWSSRAADTEGSRNYAGIKSPVVDDLIEHIASARQREDLVTAARALDRVLLWGHYVVPLFHAKYDFLTYWSHLKRPAVSPLYGTTVDLWWSESP